jgi:hypothetical protein
MSRNTLTKIKHIRPTTILLFTICNLFDQKLELDISKLNNQPTSDNRSFDKILVEGYVKVSAMVSAELFNGTVSGDWIGPCIVLILKRP